MENIKSQIKEEIPEITDEALKKICEYVHKEISSYEERIARLETFMDFVLKPRPTPIIKRRT